MSARMVLLLVVVILVAGALAAIPPVSPERRFGYTHGGVVLAIVLIALVLWMSGFIR